MTDSIQSFKEQLQQFVKETSSVEQLKARNSELMQLAVAHFAEKALGEDVSAFKETLTAELKKIYHIEKKNNVQNISKACQAAVQADLDTLESKFRLEEIDTQQDLEAKIAEFKAEFQTKTETFEFA